MGQQLKIKRALVSVSDKTGLDELGKALNEMGVEILSTGGTLKKLKDAGVPAISVSTFTGAPEIMGGRVKTLHPKVHAGILYRREVQEDVDQLAKSDYKGIDLVVVNLYPFEKVLARMDATDAELIENIDIGGPTMVRAAAKNFASVTIVTDPSDYPGLIEEMKKGEGTTSPEFRKQCAAKAFALTSRYDTAIADYFSAAKEEQANVFPTKLNLRHSFVTSLRYGENPHQQAALYARDDYKAATLITAEQLSGKELSYNNYNDLDSCLDMLLDFEEPFAAVLKHTNPCGAAIGKDITEAYKRAYDSDPLSAFGSIIGVNKPVDMACAELLHETPFVECILAPAYSDEAIALLKKKKNRRLLVLPTIEKGRLANQMVFRGIRGGMLMQTADDIKTLESSLKVVTKKSPSKSEVADMLFAWTVVKHTKSNAIVIAKDGATVGVGMGQTSRVDSSFMAVKRAGDRAKGAVVASDAFFPMPDAVEVAIEAGCTSFVQPGGSKGDDKAIEACDKAGVSMVFTGVRHFRH